MHWFDVDKQGLAKLLERRGKEFAVFELIQNAWDQNVTEVQVELTPVPGQPYCVLHVIDDDPQGFKDLSHAFTLFAESEKKGNPERRGRFNLGEKLVLALCREAEIVSTSGGVRFDAKGRHALKVVTEKGSAFRGEMRMTREEYDQVCEAVKTLLPPVPTRFNGEYLTTRDRLTTLELQLPTEIANAEGFLTRTRRNTKLHIYETLPGEKATLYEMGIPVVETGDKYHIDVQQKVPLNMDRDNVTSGYLQEARSAVLNATFQLLETADLENDTWIRNASADDSISPEAMEKVMDLRFGTKRVIFDPNDMEANKLAVSKGYTVIHGGMLNGSEWKNVRRDKLALPAGQVTPSPKAFSKDGPPSEPIPENQWTPAMKFCTAYAKKLAKLLMGENNLQVQWLRIPNNFIAAYAPGRLYFNLRYLRKSIIESAAMGNPHSTVEFIELMIHEFGHHYSSDHLSDAYHDALCRLGAALHRGALLGLTAPDPVTP